MSLDTATARALLFDVFGTCVDWRSTVTKTLWDACHFALNNPAASMASRIRLIASDMSIEDWGEVAQEWRTSYYEFTRAVARGEGGAYKTVDEHNLESLREILTKRGLIRGPDETGGLWIDSEIQELSLIWHRLDPWPDTIAGLAALGEKYSTCTLSNGNMTLLEDMQAYSGMPFTHTFSSELFNSYKPNPAIYNGAAERLGLRTSQCVMVAAHLGDLEAAKACGYQTIYVERPREETYDVEEAKKKGFVDLWITGEEEGFVAVARRMGCQS